MSTKYRIHISTSKEKKRALEAIAKRDNVPLATKASELIDLALEIEEDVALGMLADERMKNPGKFIPHHLVWK